VANPRKANRAPSQQFGGVEVQVETARQSAQMLLFSTIIGCLGFLAVFDGALLTPWVYHLEYRVIIAVNTAFAGGAGVLSVCAKYIFSIYQKD
jgi:hypothetical protein